MDLYLQLQHSIHPNLTELQNPKSQGCKQKGGQGPLFSLDIINTEQAYPYFPAKLIMPIV